MISHTPFLIALMAAAMHLTPSMAFSARSVPKPFGTTTVTALQSSMSSITEQEAQYLMAKARECAFSDTCSIEESREHLHGVLNIQVACASGAVAGHDICDDQQEVAEIVALLREHLNSGQHGLTSRQQIMFSGGLLPLTFLTLTCASILIANANPETPPFTFQEVVWATRDGYLDDLVSHFIRNGGL